jgi:hypothetical protein
VRGDYGKVWGQRGCMGAVPELYVVSGRAVVFSEEVFCPEQQIAGYDCTSVRD